MASMKRELDNVLKEYNGAETIPIIVLIALSLLHYGSSVKNYVRDRSLAERMIRRCYKIRVGRGGGVVNPFYKAPRKRRSILKRNHDGSINMAKTKANFDYSWEAFTKDLAGELL